MPASDMAMATACFRSVTIGPRLLPLCNIPALYSFMTFLTLPRFLLPSSESGISVIRRQEHGCREADDGPRRPELGVGRARQANLGHAAGDADIEELRYRKTADSADGRAARDDVSGPADRANDVDEERPGDALCGLDGKLAAREELVGHRCADARVGDGRGAQHLRCGAAVSGHRRDVTVIASHWPPPTAASASRDRSSLSRPHRLSQSSRRSLPSG